MYTACLYCTRTLHRNDIFELLPIGRRIAFDPRAGHLWVVCVHCGKWNLVPFDSRLETIDRCDSVFRDTHTRFSTDNIGLARLRDGTELIRIGPALRPEYASWRYGRSMRVRRRADRGGNVDSLGALNWFVAALWRGALGSLPIREVTVGAVRALHQHRVLRDPWTDQLVQVPYLALMQATLSGDASGCWVLEVPYRSAVDITTTALTSIRDMPSLGLYAGAGLLPALGRVLPALDARVPGGAAVAEAVRLVETAGDQRRLLEYVPGRPLRFATQRQYPLREIAGEVRLALEMLAHEDTERRAMAGELRLLERDWREAERLAAIADRLAVEAAGW